MAGLSRLAGLAGLTIVGLALSACGGQAPATGGGAGGEASSGAASGPKVGIFVDNAFGDTDFFDQAGHAVEPLKAKGASVRTYEGQLKAQNFEPLLQDAAGANQLVFVIGFEAIDALGKVAKDSPDTTFVFIDSDLKNPDVVSAVFKTQEGCFMAGALAATVNGTKGSKVAGFVGGMNAPVVKNCESGFDQGVKKVDPAQNVAAQYVGSFVDPAKGREATIALQGKGAYAVYPYAGLTGVGTFDAAKSGIDVAPVGIVSDKSHLAPGKSPGSLEMGVDQVILQLTDAYSKGELKKGSRHDYGFANGGWNMVYNKDFLKPDQISGLEKLQAQVVSGEIKVAD